MTYAEACAILEARGSYTEQEKTILYTHYLVARGDFNGLVDFLAAFSDEERAAIVNATLYNTYWGNTLHTCAYWNTGDNALAIYRYLDAAGARPVLDYYDDYPWNTTGIVYACPIRGLNIAHDHDRDNDEFAETHADIERYFVAAGAGAGARVPADLPLWPGAGAAGAAGAAGGAGAGARLPLWPGAGAGVQTNFWRHTLSGSVAHCPLAASCPLHVQRGPIPYTRNSNGHYSSFAPACNGCVVGGFERGEATVAETVREETVNLLNAWSSAYTATTGSEASAIAERLQTALNHLRTLSGIIVTPIDLAERALELHAAALALDAAINASETCPLAHARLIDIHRDAFLVIGDRVAVGNVYGFPLTGAALDKAVALRMPFMTG